MVDPHLQERFTRRCTDAAFGYTAATTAAYAAFAEQVFDFWADMLAPSKPAKASTPAWGWPVPVRQQPPAMPFAPFIWPTALPRGEAHAGFPLAGFPFPAGATPNPLQAWLDMWTAPPASWPMAFMLIASGMPRSVAWPTAEANVAVMDAADAAAGSVRQAFASYRAVGGHSGRQWPPAQLMMLAALAPLGFGTLLMNVRMT
jgi:hypothetical protein